MSIFEQAIAVGFTKKQAEFIENSLAKKGHAHDIEDVVGLPDALESLTEDEEEEEED